LTNTPTNTPTATDTLTNTPTNTPVAPTDTPTNTPTNTLTPTPGPGIIVNRTTITFTETSIVAIYNVRLATAPQPGEVVTIRPEYDDSQIFIAPSSRQITRLTWNIGRNFVVIVIDDDIDEPDPHFTTITHRATSNLAGSPYNGLTGGEIIVSIHDND
jgi:hypothetical protein